MEKIKEFIFKLFEWLKKDIKHKVVFILLVVSLSASTLVMTGCTSFRVDKASVEGLELIKEVKEK